MAIGAAIGAGASMLTGIGQAIAGAIQQKKAEKNMPAEEDAEQRAELERIKQDMRSMRSGTDATTQAQLRGINQGTAQAQSAISRNTGGNVGGTISGILQAQRTGANQAGQSYGQARQNANYFQGLRDQAQNRIAQRKLELGMYRNQQDRARAATNEQAGFQNIAQGASSGLGMLGGMMSRNQGAQGSGSLVGQTISQGMGDYMVNETGNIMGAMTNLNK